VASAVIFICEYLPSPFTIEDLLHVLKRVLELSSI